MNANTLPTEIPLQRGDKINTSVAWASQHLGSAHLQLGPKAARFGSRRTSRRHFQVSELSYFIQVHQTSVALRPQRLGKKTEIRIGANYRTNFNPRSAFAS
jgi:hypothetical protein